MEMLDSIGREQRAARQASTALEFNDVGFVKSQKHMVMHGYSQTSISVRGSEHTFS
jgi:hypothetical protein